MQSAKEAASNMAASAKAGMDKTKATVQEKVERMTAHNPMEKDMATQRKQEKMDEAEWNKQAAREHNVAGRQHSTTTGHMTTGGGMDPVSTLHGHGTTGQHTTMTGLNPMQGHGTTGLNPMQGHGTTGLNPMQGHGTTGQVDEGAFGTNMAPNDPRLGGGYTQTGTGTGAHGTGIGTGAHGTGTGAGGYGTGTGTGGAYR